jgi:hypothetical protein
VIIAEPSFWEPQTPLLYQGVIELWQDSQRCDQVQVSHGLRKLQLGPRGLRLNASPLTLRGVQRSQCSQDEARSLHTRGYNTVLACFTEAADIWNTADRFGLLILHGLVNTDDVQQATALCEHPCCLGWVVPEGENHAQLVKAALALADASKGHYLGIELNFTPEAPLPKGISFLVCEARYLADVAAVPLPKIVLLGKDTIAPASSDVLGWIVC